MERSSPKIVPFFISVNFTHHNVRKFSFFFKEEKVSFMLLKKIPNFIMNQDISVNKKSFYFLSSLFFMWGFITVTNDILINTFKGIFDLTAPQRSLVQSAFFGAFFIVSLIYFLISSSTGKDPINRIGYKNGMAISLAVCGIGCLMFYGGYAIYRGIVLKVL